MDRDEISEEDLLIVFEGMSTRPTHTGEITFYLKKIILDTCVNVSQHLLRDWNAGATGASCGVLQCMSGIRESLPESGR